MSLMISISGIRGLVGEDINPKTVVKFVGAFVNGLYNKNSGSPKPKFLVCRDTRISGEYISGVVVSTLLALGADVLNIGISPTPTGLFATRYSKCSGGIIVTASHNPIEWNALKLCDAEGLFLDKDMVNNIADMFYSVEEVSAWKDSTNLGRLTQNEDFYKSYIDEILKHFDITAIRNINFRVAYDPVGGAATLPDTYFFEKLNCITFPVNHQITGFFPRNPEPTPANLSELSKTVIENKADIGFAQDPDADRLAIVDENGKVLSEEYTIVIAGDSYLSRNKTDLVCNLSTTMRIEELARKYGVDVHRTRIGEANVTEKLLSGGFDFGGEGNGGVIVPSINPARDSFVGMALVLELMAHSNKKISEIAAQFTDFKMLKDKIELDNPINSKEIDVFYDKIHNNFKKEFPEGELVTEDGVKVTLKNGWLHIRNSNTEPQIRLIAESTDEKLCMELIEKGKYIVNSILK